MSQIMKGVKKASYNLYRQKGAVQQVLDEDLVEQTQRVLNDLPCSAESSQSDTVVSNKTQPIAHAKSPKVTIATWNNFNAQYGSFADEYSTL